jgi:hypothetical protein
MQFEENCLEKTVDIPQFLQSTNRRMQEHSNHPHQVTSNAYKLDVTAHTVTQLLQCEPV